MVEAEKKKQEIASGKKPTDEEVQKYFDDQAQHLKDLEKAQRESLASLHDQQRRLEEAASGATSSVPSTTTNAQEQRDDEQLVKKITTVLHEEIFNSSCVHDAHTASASSDGDHRDAHTASIEDVAHVDAPTLVFDQVVDVPFE